MNLIEEVPAQDIAPIDPSAQKAYNPVQRGLAIAQQLKDTITIGLMLVTGMLFCGVLFGIGIPGLVLYFLRRKLVSEGASPSRQGWLWLLTAAHELLWAVIFCNDHSPNDEFMQGYLGIGYALGTLISTIALLNSGWLTSAKQQ